MGIENLSRSQVSNMAKEMDEQVETFRNRSLRDTRYPVLLVDALYEKVRYDGRVVSMAILFVCGVNEAGLREVLAVEPMLEKSRESYAQLFERLKNGDCTAPPLVISDAYAGLGRRHTGNIPGAYWQRCKVYFIRNILVHVPHRDKQIFAEKIKQIWLALYAQTAYKRAAALVEEFEKRFPQTMGIHSIGR